MLRPWVILIFVSFIQCSSASATKYYVSSTNGDDNRDGKTEATAWKTISKVNGYSFTAGDIISFKRGDLWREKLTVSRSGSAGNHMIFTAYGTGDKPKIYGSEITTWTAEGHTNIWKSTATFKNPYGQVQNTEYCEIFFVELDGTVAWRSGQKTYTSDFANLTVEYDWTWDASTVFIYSATDPNTTYSAVEIPQRDIGIYIGNYDYITIDNLEIRYAAIGIDSYQQTSGQNRIGFTLSNCKICWIGSKFHQSSGDEKPGNGYGTAVMRSDLIFRGNDIGYTGRRLISSHLYSASNLTLTNMLYEDNYLHDGGHGTGVSPRFNGNPNKIDGLIIRNNIFYEPPTYVPGTYTANMCSIWASVPGSEIKNVKIYNNLFMHGTYWNVDLVGNVVNVEIYNNTFFEHNKRTNKSTNLVFIALSGINSLAPSNVIIKNNIFYCTGLKSVTAYQYAILIKSGATSAAITEMDYNLFYYSDHTLTVVCIETGSVYYYTSGGAKNMDDLYADLRWQEHSPTNYLLSPQFVSEVDVADLHLQSDSPAIGKGINVIIGDSVLAKDFDGKYYNNPPSVGAYEANPGYTPPPPPPIIPSDRSEQILILYPNPAQGYLTVAREGSTLELQSLRIINMAGKILFKDFIEQGVTHKQFPINISSGIYFVQVLYGNLTTAAQELIVVK